MSAPKHNEFWKQRSSHGRNPIFGSPDELREACQQYFQWVDDHPLVEVKAFAFQGEITTANIPRMRAMTISGLCIFLDIGLTTWADYREREGFSWVSTRVEAIISTQKFEGAAAGLLTPSIIARDLGLSDKSEITGTMNAPLVPIINLTLAKPDEDAA